VPDGLLIVARGPEEQESKDVFREQWQPFPEAQYTLADLGGFTGGDQVQAWAKAVNDPGSSGLMQVVGYSFAPGARTRVLGELTSIRSCWLPASNTLVTDYSPPNSTGYGSYERPADSFRAKRRSRCGP
jgi:hypothetical protein